MAILHEINIPADLPGCQYIHEAIMMATEDAGIAKNSTDELYALIATKHHTAPDDIKDAMSQAIEYAWGKHNANPCQTFDYFLNNCRHKPQTHEFIKLIAERLLQIFS
jgi:two-component system response regulator (stage 0 sporulation protein A)